MYIAPPRYLYVYIYICTVKLNHAPLQTGTSSDFCSCHGPCLAAWPWRPIWVRPCGSIDTRSKGALTSWSISGPIIDPKNAGLKGDMRDISSQFGGYLHWSSSRKTPSRKPQKKSTSPSVLPPATCTSAYCSCPKCPWTHRRDSFEKLRILKALISIYDLYIYIYTQMTPIFDGQPPKTRPFPIKTRVIWVPGYLIYSNMSISEKVRCFLPQNRHESTWPSQCSALNCVSCGRPVSVDVSMLGPQALPHDFH